MRINNQTLEDNECFTARFYSNISSIQNEITMRIKNETLEDNECFTKRFY